MKKSLHELLGWRGPTTNRQLGAWNRFLLRELNRPNLTEMYLMRVAYEIRAFAIGLGGGKNDLSFDDFRLKFENDAATESKKAPPLTDQEKADRSRAMWLGMFGFDKHGKKVAETGFDAPAAAAKPSERNGPRPADGRDMHAGTAPRVTMIDKAPLSLIPADLT